MGALLDGLDFGEEDLSERERLKQDLFTTASTRLGSAQENPYVTSPYRFLTECVYTRDEADEQAPVKRWPGRACPSCRIYQVVERTQCSRCGGPLSELIYKEITETWLTAKPSILVIPKPRRFMMSWIFAALHTWLAIVRRESSIYFQSRVEEDSKLLIDRCEFIIKNIPRDKLVPPPFERKEKPPQLLLGNGSKIIGKPEGKNALRGVTATAVLMDEIAFWEHPRASYEAIKPLVEKNCRLTICSSAAPGFFKNLVEGDQ